MGKDANAEKTAGIIGESSTELSGAGGKVGEVSAVIEPSCSLPSVGDSHNAASNSSSEGELSSSS